MLRVALKVLTHMAHRMTNAIRVVARYTSVTEDAETQGEQVEQHIGAPLGLAFFLESFGGGHG